MFPRAEIFFREFFEADDTLSRNGRFNMRHAETAFFIIADESYRLILSFPFQMKLNIMELAILIMDLSRQIREARYINLALTT